VLHIDPSRLKPWIGDPPRVSAPDVPGYRIIAHERFNVTTGTLAGFALIPLWGFLIAGAVAMLGGRTSYDASLSLSTILYGAIVGLVLVPVLHEAVHGLAALLAGAKPSYGIGPGFAYTTFRDPVPRLPYLAIGLAPLVLLTIASVILASHWNALAGWLVFFGVVNASGAIGDLWMSWRIIRQPRTAIFFDLADGFAVLIPEHEAQEVVESVDRV
jgi:hypothetical protein